MRILVSGAGPAGLTAAYWLDRNGNNVVLVERTDHLRLDGYGLDFFGTGFDVADRMGIVDELFNHKLKSEFLNFVDTEGNEIGSVSIDALTEKLGGRYVPLMHYTLEQTLFDALPASVDVRFGTQIDTVEESADDVAVRFDDGSTEAFDIVVGAEGVNSHLRRLAFGPDEEYTNYLGFQISCFLFENDLDIPAGWVNLASVAKSVAAYPTDRDGMYASLFIWSEENPRPVHVDNRVSVLRDHFADIGWLAGDIIERAPDPSEVFADSVTQIRMPSWRSGRVALIGDAAYCLTLLSGQGSSMAMAGAYILAEELALADSYTRAFENYENRLRPHIEYRQEKAKDLVRSFVPGSERAAKAEMFAFKLLLRDAFAGPLAHSLYMGDSVIRERMLHRLPDSRGNVLGYRIAGTVEPNDIAMIRLDVETALRDHDNVNIVCVFDDFEHVNAKGLLADIRFDRSYAKRIHKIAIVGDSVRAKAFAIAAKPFGEYDAQHFSLESIDDAWMWAGAER
jgi:2-polyprenyl-6-methoxyphenol hydroxylase-like FAD-dependent oxidoreductase